MDQADMNRRKRLAREDELQLAVKKSREECIMLHAALDKKILLEKKKQLKAARQKSEQEKTNRMGQFGSAGNPWIVPNGNPWIVPNRW